MNVKVGPFYGGREDEMLTIQTYQSRTRKPSVELLESVRLRPTYYSFPQFNYDQSPIVPSFRFPQYSFYSLKEPSLQSPSSNSVLNRSSPKSSGVGDKQPEGGKTTLFGTVVNCSNFFFGIGIIALPFALKLSGWVGLAILLVLGAVTYHTALLLGKCQQRYSLDTYPDIVEAAFGTCGRMTLSLAFYIQLLFEVTIFMVLLSQSLALLLLLPSLSPCSVSLLCTALLVVLANTFTTAKTLSGLSVASWMATIMLVVALLVAFAFRIVHHLDAEHIVTPSTTTEGTRHLLRGMNGMFFTIPVNWKLPVRDLLRDTQTVTDWRQVMHSLGIMSFCFVGHAVLPSVLGHMQRPARYSEAVLVSFATMGAGYLLLGVGGYLAFGAQTHSNILLDIYAAAASSTSALAVAVSVAVNLLVVLTASSKFSLAAVPITESLFEWASLTVRRLKRNRRLSRELSAANSRSSNDYFAVSGYYSESPHSDEEARRYHTLFMERRRSKDTDMIEAPQSVSAVGEEETERSPVPGLSALRRTFSVESIRSTTSSDVAGSAGGKLPTPFTLLADNDQSHNFLAENRLSRSASTESRQLLSPTALSGRAADLWALVDSSRQAEDRQPFQGQSSSCVEETKEGPGVEESSRGMETPFKKNSKLERRSILSVVCHVAIRTFLPVIALGLSTLFPHFADLLTFTGGLFGALISVALPAACYLRIFGAELGCLEWTATCCIMLIGLGIVGITVYDLFQTH